jgi:hypothetical protein
MTAQVTPWNNNDRVSSFAICNVFHGEKSFLDSSHASDCVKTPFMVRLDSPGTEARTETNYLAVRPEQRRRANDTFSHSLAFGMTDPMAS